MVEESIEVERTVTETETFRICDGCGQEVKDGATFREIDPEDEFFIQDVEGDLRVDLCQGCYESPGSSLSTIRFEDEYLDDQILIALSLLFFAYFYAFLTSSNWAPILGLALSAVLSFILWRLGEHT